uniref:Fcf2 pre-rRNA processing C-terminal domain-containing protein n=1 Tax=Romanomermis culicivorax TaxID=13658 RepID=A0A915K1Q2_ROMCU
MNVICARRSKVFAHNDAEKVASDSEDDNSNELEMKRKPNVNFDPNLKAALSAIWDGKLFVPKNTVAESMQSNKDAEFCDLFFIDTGHNSSSKDVTVVNNDQKIDGKLIIENISKISSSPKTETSLENKDAAHKKIDEIMKKSVITSEYHSQEKVLPYYQSINAQRKKRKDWFDLPATELTDERKHDLEIMALRDVLDTKSFYRKDDRRVLPKYYQIGTVIEDATDFYSDRIPKKQRKQTIVDELLASSEFQKRQKAKYKEILMKKKAIAPKSLKFKKKKRKNDDK